VPLSFFTFRHYAEGWLGLDNGFWLGLAEGFGLLWLAAKLEQWVLD
jgi:hypothetical protein